MDVLLMTILVWMIYSDGVITAIWSSAFNAATRAHWSVIERLRGHRHDAESIVRLPQTQVRRPVSNSRLLLTFLTANKCKCEFFCVAAKQPKMKRKFYITKKWNSFHSPTWSTQNLGLLLIIGFQFINSMLFRSSRKGSLSQVMWRYFSANMA